MSLVSWLRARDGIGHRDDAADAGYSPRQVRAAIRSGAVQRIRSKWVCLPTASRELVEAARSGGQLTCVSLARRRGWWVPPDADERCHLRMPPNGVLQSDAQAHWATPFGPQRRRALETAVEDGLADAAQCFPLDQAAAIWESAMRTGAVTLESLQQVPWRTAAAKRCLQHVRPGTGSSLETVVHVRLSSWGVPVRLQVHLAGHDVDFLIGTHLVVQIDGWAYHSSTADRTRDITHDAELRLRGYTVLRFSYAQVIHGWEHVERTLASAISRGLHLAPSARRPSV